MKKTIPLLFALLFSFASSAQDMGVVQFNIGPDPENANVMAVIGGGAGMINIYRYNAYEHADRMPMPFHKDDSLHIWSYRCKDQTGSSWTLYDERTTTATTPTFTAMKNAWLTFKEYSNWWVGKNGLKADGKIYQTPSKKGVVISNDSVKCRTFKVTEVNGDWIKVSYSASGCALVTQGETVGWVMWRRKSQVLVNFR